MSIYEWAPRDGEFLELHEDTQVGLQGGGALLRRGCGGIWPERPGRRGAEAWGMRYEVRWVWTPPQCAGVPEMTLEMFERFEG